ncbi:MAG: SpoIID/LytB domain-containing protein [Terracidiphilus sp.]
MKAIPPSPRRVLLLALLVAIAPALAQSPLAKPASHPPATLRVGLWTLWHDKDLTISATPDSGATLRTCETCAASPLNYPMQIRATASKLTLPTNRQPASVRLTGPITLAAHGETLTLHNPLRVSARNGELILAVTLPVETYVERVVASESGSADTPESLKALAIVVRSFALHQPHGHTDYDLCDSTHCQLLHWGAKPQPDATEKLGAPSFPRPFAERVGNLAAHAATLATAGETLWFHGQRAEAWFHQNCGGRTASPSEVWLEKGPARKPMPWLTSRTDSYCTANGAREWSANLSLSDLTGALAAAGLVRPGWKTLTVARRGESGRAVILLLASTEISASTEITAEDFRLAVGRALGWNRILSTWFEVSRQGDQFLFHGRGSGHGVGLCQAGAAAMGALGHDSSQILAQYFPGAIAADESTGFLWQTLRAQGFALETLAPTDAVYLPQLSQALADAESRSGLQVTDPITVRAFRSTPAFRDATLAPGWVAAFTEGNWIATQPLPTLASRKLLVPILRHEFLHALVESQAVSNAPLWLREGLVEVWSGDAKPTTTPPALKLDQIDRALAHAATEAQSQAAHRAAAWYATRLLDRFGRAQVLAWLRSAVPASALAALQ